MKLKRLVKSVMLNLLLLFFLQSQTTAQVDTTNRLSEQFSSQVKPLLGKYCAECHGKDLAEAEIDFSTIESVTDARKQVETWQRVSDVFIGGQMPPKDASQPSEDERARLTHFLTSFLTLEAQRLSGDPGTILLRRLSNAEYTHSIRSLTQVATLDPAREFPVDGASGEGFTNAGSGLVMSPSLFTKYLDAGKEVARHAVLLPDGIRFSPSTSRRDWTEEALADIRAIYARYSAAEGGTEVNLQGVVFNTNGGGRLPIEDYLRATIEERRTLTDQSKSIEQVARERRLSHKYLSLLWNALGQPQGQLNQQLSDSWKQSNVDSIPQLLNSIHQWQQALWKFNSVGHIGKVNGPKSWMEAMNPIATSQDFRFPMPKPPVPGNTPNSNSPRASNDNDEVVLYLVTGDAGDGSKGDEVVWKKPRFVGAGRPDLLLKDLRRISHAMKEASQSHLSITSKALAAADSLIKSPNQTIAELAQQYQCEEQILEGWFEYLGIKSGQQFQITGHLSRTISSASGYDFVKGWVGDDALGVMANSSDTHVRVPGNMYPHSLAVHPAPTVQLVIGWSSPVTAKLKVSGHVRHAHPECGNGVVWALQLRRGPTVQTLANGVAHGDRIIPIELPGQISVTPTDVLCLVIGPRDGNHSCDLTNVQLVFETTEAQNSADAKKWDLSADLSGSLLAGNPHEDSFGNKQVWHFFGEPVSGPSGPVIPAGSMLAKWQASGDSNERSALAHALEQALTRGATADTELSKPDQELVKQLRSLGGPLLANALKRLCRETNSQEEQSSHFGLAAREFGMRENGSISDPESLYVRSPSVIELRLPASLVEGTELVTSGSLVESSTDQDGQQKNALEAEGSVQLSITGQPPHSTELVASTTIESANSGAWTSSGTRVSSLQPIIVAKTSSARQRFEKSFDNFRFLFPAALCYTKIVPVDEVVTLTLYYREDEPLQQLMLNADETQRLNQLWDELHYLSRDALALVDAYEQLWQYATQDADPSAFEPLRTPIMNRAADFRQQLKSSEAKHLIAVEHFADRALRRPLSDSELVELRNLYTKLRDAEVPHELAIQSLIARALVSPAFLYRIESGSGPVLSLADGEVRYRKLSQHELATRLSYFLTSSPPDDTLRNLADSGRLADRGMVIEQVHRLISGPSARNLATEFGCQWLHIYDFAAHDEKSEQTFPTFNALRASMYEESIRFWTDLFQQNRSVLDLIESENMFVNEALAEHYGIDWDSTSTAAQLDRGWRRLPHAQQYGRGGIMAMASVLSKQSGASRTSPILRGNWICEVVLGDKLPKPPQGVPVLPESPPEGLTERQLIEKHSSDPACAKCHVKIDPFGFALEGYDAIGRKRDPAKYDTKTVLADGTPVAGLEGLRDYVLNQRRDQFIRQFCRKLLGYSLGRAVQLSDQPLLEQMQKTLHENRYQVQAAIELVVLSPQFQHTRVD